MKTYQVKDKCNGQIYKWSISDLLYEINRDHSDLWANYDESDWVDGLQWIHKDDCIELISAIPSNLMY